MLSVLATLLLAPPGLPQEEAPPAAEAAPAPAPAPRGAIAWLDPVEGASRQLAVGRPSAGEGDAGEVACVNSVSGVVVWRLSGRGPNSALGTAVAPARDVDGDGVAEVVAVERDGGVPSLAVISGADGTRLGNVKLGGLVDGPVTVRLTGPALDEEGLWGFGGAVVGAGVVAPFAFSLPDPDAEDRRVRSLSFPLTKGERLELAEGGALLGFLPGDGPSKPGIVVADGDGAVALRSHGGKSVALALPADTSAVHLALPLAGPRRLDMLEASTRALLVGEAGGRPFLAELDADRGALLWHGALETEERPVAASVFDQRGRRVVAVGLASGPVLLHDLVAHQPLVRVSFGSAVDGEHLGLDLDYEFDTGLALAVTGPDSDAGPWIATGGDGWVASELAPR